LNNKECTKNVSCRINIRKENNMINQSHPQPEEGKCNAYNEVDVFIFSDNHIDAYECKNIKRNLEWEKCFVICFKYSKKFRGIERQFQYLLS
jgi:hypothetical protein